MKTNTPFLNTQHGGIGACGGMAEKFPPLPPLSPHVIFIFRVSIFFEKSFRVQKMSGDDMMLVTRKE